MKYEERIIETRGKISKQGKERSLDVGLCMVQE